MSKSVFPMLIRAVAKRLLLCLPVLLIAPIASATAQAVDEQARAQLAANYGQLPLGFEANRGQFDAPVRYLAQGQGYRLFLTDDETVLSLRAHHAASADTTAVLRSRLLGAQSPAPLLAEQLQPGRSHYFHGQDAARWVHGVEHFGRVRYQQVYPGVDLVYYGTQGQLEYDFELAPQADPRQIRMRYSGVSGATLSARGELLLHTAGGDVTLKKPEVYQHIGGQRSAVAGRYTYRRHADAVDVAFEIGDYDRNRALVIDPVLIYSSYLGGSGNDFASGGTYGVAVNAKGELYVIGSTQSANFPTQSPRQPAHAADGGTFDVFVSKFAADGQSLVYSTYLGGSGSDQGFGIALNAAGEAYITGSTNSVDFPVSAALYPNRSGNTDPEVTASDAFVSRISADGQTLIYSSYLGGSDDDNAQYGSDVGYSIALDSSGAFYVAGRTSSVHSSNSDPENPTTAVLFPTTPGAVQTAPGSGSAADAFVTKFAADGQSLAYSTLLGGSGNELAYAIAVDASQQAYVTGITQSTNFPLQSALQGSSGGGADAFVVSLAANGQALRYSTYLGGSGTDTAYAIAVSGAGRAYLTGSTGSANFPTKSALDATIGGSSDAFVSIVAADGTLDYSSFLGGASSDVGHGIALDGGGLIDVVGYSSSADFPVKDAVQGASAGGSEAFVSQFAADGSSQLFGSLLGGSSTDQGLGIAVDTLGNIYIAGVTQSATNFHTQAPFQAVSGGGLDAFVAKIGTPVVIAPGSLALSSAAYNVVESAGSVSITVSRSGGSSGAAAVDYATSNGSAAAGSDYTAASGTLNWADGDSADKTIELTIANDEQLEPDESFTLNLGNASGAALGTPASATITITNDDAARPGTLQFDAATYFVDESGGSLVVNVTRTGGSDGAASVNYATSPGSATAGSDYQTSSGTLSWADGDAASKSFTVTIGNDAALEGNETFNLVLSGASGASLGETKAATATIVDDEASQPGVIKLGASSYAVAESAGTLSVTVLRDIGSDGAVSVQYTTSNGTAAAGSDYTLTGGTLSWADGDMSARTISVPIVDDSLFEGAETFGISLGSATGGALLGSPASATVTITDNDVAANGSLQLDASSYEVREDGGALRITVTRTDGNDGAVTVRYATSAGTATSNVDFTAASGTLTWPAGDNAPKTVDIAILQDSLYEGREAFGFALSSPSGGARLGTPSSATISLIDDEVMRGTLQLSDAAFSVSEGGGSVSISVLRSGGSDGAVSVDYASSDASALSPGDYTAVSGTLNWADGDTEPKRIVVAIIDDAEYENAPETFTVKLGGVSGGAALGTPDTATVTILDNEVRPGALQFEAAAYRVVENTGVVKLTVDRVGGTDNAVTVRYSTNQGTAVGGSDYNASSGSLSWAAGDATPRVLTIQTIDDAAFEGDETFSVALSQPTGGAALGGPASTTITIADDEVAFAGGLRFGASAYEVDEAAGSIAIAVVRGGSSDGSVSVAYSTVNGQAVSGADYIATSGRLTWADGDMEPKTIAVQILRDSSLEGAENFSVVLSSPTGGVTLDNPSSASIVITDANADDDGSGSSGKGGGGAVDPRWLAVLLAAAMMRAAMRRRGG